MERSGRQSGPEQVVDVASLGTDYHIPPMMVDRPSSTFGIRPDFLSVCQSGHFYRKKSGIGISGMPAAGDVGDEQIVVQVTSISGSDRAPYSLSLVD